MDALVTAWKNNVLYGDTDTSLNLSEADVNAIWETEFTRLSRPQRLLILQALLTLPGLTADQLESYATWYLPKRYRKFGYRPLFEQLLAHPACNESTVVLLLRTNDGDDLDELCRSTGHLAQEAHRSPLLIPLLAPMLPRPTSLTVLVADLKAAKRGSRENYDLQMQVREANDAHRQAQQESDDAFTAAWQTRLNELYDRAIAVANQLNDGPPIALATAAMLFSNWTGDTDALVSTCRGITA